MVEKYGALPVTAPALASAPTVPVSPPGLAPPALTVVASRRIEPAAALPAGDDPPDDHPEAPPGVAFIPTEDVLLLTVQLPAMSASQRRQSVAFAVEDAIAQPLDEVQVALGPEVPDAAGHWLVAVVGEAALPASTRGRTPRLVPDVFAVPRPATGWAVWVGARRALVRKADSAGFAVRLGLLPVFWTIAGRPPIILYGGQLPPGMVAASNAVLPGGLDPSLGGFDLSAGRTGGNRRALPGDMRALIVVAAFAVVAHLGLLAVDVAALGRVADDRERALREMLSASGVAVDDDPDQAVAAMLAARDPAAADGFLPTMQRAFEAIAPEAGRVTLQGLRYSRADGSVVLRVEAPDIETLQAVEQAFGDAGLGVVAGAATTAAGAAEAEMTLRGSAS